MACTRSDNRTPNLSGTWISKSLVYLDFIDKERVLIGDAFTPGDKTYFRQTEDSLFFSRSNLYENFDRGISERYGITFVDSTQFILTSDNQEMSESRSKFFSANTMLKSHLWDSLVISKSYPAHQGMYTFEHMQIYSTGRLTLERLKSEDTLHLTASLDTVENWPLIKNQISMMDSSYYYLDPGPVSHAEFLEIHLYRNGVPVLKREGWGMPYLFRELRDFVCCYYPAERIW